MERNKAVRNFLLISLILSFLIWMPFVGGAQKKAEAEKTVEVKAPSEYRYNSIGKPDPFKPFIDDEIEAKKKIEKAIPLAVSPLQREGIEQFRLVGISGDERDRKAIVQDIKGRFYPLFIGTYIGLNNGKVVQILTDRVIIEEETKLRAGKKKVNRITMKLRKELEEVKP